MTDNLTRLDLALVTLKLASSRTKAKEMIKAGMVRVNGQTRDKASLQVSPEDRVTLDGSLYPYVSRAGSKLEKALEDFSINLDGLTCMDVGASTGGFTDCMLAHGACKIYAIDSGRDQLATKLREDKRVVSMEETNMRYLKREELGEKIAFAAVDVSFISLAYIFLPLRGCLCEGAKVVCLVKPQFEAGRSLVGKGGLVRHKKVHENVLRKVIACARDTGFSIHGLTWSPLRGQSGNIEFLLFLKAETGTDSFDPSLITEIVRQAHFQTI